MTSIVIRTEADRNHALYEIEEGSIEPIREVIIQEYHPGKKRSDAQNRLAFLWYREAAVQLKDETAEDKRGYCKLHFGVGILKAGSSSVCRHFADQYDAIIKPLTYEQKRAVMIEPFNLPVTSLMGVEQFREYLEQVDHFFSSQSVKLSRPEDLYYEAMKR